MSGQELKEKQWRNTTAYWLTSANFLYQLPRDSDAHNGPGPPTSAVNQDSTTQTRLQASLKKGSSLVEVPSSQVAVGCINVTIKTNWKKII